jgi:hypothetical protein
MKKHCDSLEMEIKKLSSQSHTSSMLVLQKDDQQRSEARIDMSQEQKSSSSGFSHSKSEVQKGAAVEVTIERRQSSSYQMTTDYSGSKTTSRKGSASGSRPGSRHGSRAASRGASPTPFDSQQQTTDEESELRRILEDSRGRRTKFNH